MMHALGRRVEHDSRSRQYPARWAAKPKTVLWGHYAPVLAQGTLRSCTGNALTQCLNTAHFKPSRLHGKYLDETVARSLYSRATHLDSDPDFYPPTDTGSSGLAVAKAGVEAGYLTSYTHAFGMDHFLAAVQLSPVIVGTRWDNNMFTPDPNGFIHPGGGEAGGHEYLILGANLSGKYVTMLNSWGGSWGRHGRARISFEDFSGLLDDHGDVTVPIGKS